MTSYRFKVGETQVAGLQGYVFDRPVPKGKRAQEFDFPGKLEGGVLTVHDPNEAVSHLVDATNSADDAKDVKVRDALCALQTRIIRRSAKRNPSQRADVDKPNPQMLGFMNDNRKRIEKATGLKITQTDDKPLGCGGYGCAYATDDKRWIVKVSTDATEAALVKSVMDIRAENGGGDGTGPSVLLPGIAFFEGIWIRPDRRGKSMFVFVRENVDPFEDVDVLKLDWFGALGAEHPNVVGKYGTTALNLTVEYAADFYDAGNNQQKATEAIDSYIKWVEIIRHEMPLVADAMEDFLSRGIVLRDVHDRNVGRTVNNWGHRYRKKGSIVIFDLGFTPTDPGRGYRRLNPTLSEEEAEKLASRAPARHRSAEKGVIDSTRSPVAPTLHSKWTWPVKIPRL
jgi:hypothetical protein